MVIDGLDQTFREAISHLIVTAVRGGLLYGGLLGGKSLAIEWFESPSIRKVALVSMPIAAVIGGFFAFCSFRFVVDPGETRAEAIHDAQLTFFIVVVTLWSGCIWGAVKLMPGASKTGAP